MSDNILKFPHPTPEHRDQPDPNIIAVCRAMLELAEEGKLQFLHLMGWLNEGQHITAIGGLSPDYFATLGALDKMKDDFKAKYSAGIQRELN